MPTTDESPDLLPVRMLNEYAYCPRLFHLMHVEGRWAENAYTIEGRDVHRRVDRIDDVLPDPPNTDSLPEAGDEGEEPPEISRSVSLGSELLGLTAKLDLVSTAGEEAVPVETKRGRVPDPLEDSPKCNGCSLSGICLPDETLALRAVPADPPAAGMNAVRRLYPPRDDALPLYVQEQGARVGKKASVLVIKKGAEELGTARLKDVSQLVLCGNVGVSAQTVHLLCEAEIPIVHLSTGHWFYGVTHGITLRNAYDRAAQFRAAADPRRVVAFARAIVSAKGANQRTLLARNARPRPDDVLAEIAALLNKVEHTPTAPELLGLEGGIAARYFSRFSSLLRPRDFESTWEFEARNRRPPRDPVNALLSFGYALLAKECTVALLAEGLDPWWGLYHQPRHGRPSLALDLMEEFRPLVVDSAVITAINTGMVTSRNFSRSKAACVLGPSGRKAFIRAYESRLAQLVTHPLFDYRCSWRSVIRLQARLLARWLRGDVPEYVGMTTR